MRALPRCRTDQQDANDEGMMNYTFERTERRTNPKMALRIYTNLPKQTIAEQSKSGLV